MLQVASREAELAEKLIAKQRQCDLLLLEISDLAAQLAETEYFDDEGFNSPIDWMRFKCHLSEKAAADRIAVGRMAPKLAESVQALHAGEIGFAHSGNHGADCGARRAARRPGRASRAGAQDDAGQVL